MSRRGKTREQVHQDRLDREAFVQTEFRKGTPIKDIARQLSSTIASVKMVAQRIGVRHLHSQADAIRGFPVPPHLLGDYKHLVYSKHVPAKEAARMLGIPTGGAA